MLEIDSENGGYHMISPKWLGKMITNSQHLEVSHKVFRQTHPYWVTVWDPDSQGPDTLSPASHWHPSPSAYFQFISVHDKTSDWIDWVWNCGVTTHQNLQLGQSGSRHSIPWNEQGCKDCPWGVIPILERRNDCKTSSRVAEMPKTTCWTTFWKPKPSMFWPKQVFSGAFKTTQPHERKNSCIFLGKFLLSNQT